MEAERAFLRYHIIYSSMQATAMKQGQVIGRMNSPTLQADLTGDDSVLPLHAETSPMMMPLHYVGSSSSEDSSTDSFWSSSTAQSERDINFCLPTWSASPQSPAIDRSSPLTVHQHTSSSFGLNSSRRLPFLIVGFILVGIAALFTSQTTLHSAAAQVSTLENHRDELDGKLRKYERDIRALEREISAMDLLIQRQQDIDSQSYQLQANHESALSEMSELQQRLHTEAVQAQNLKRQVQAISRNDIAEKYGNGVHEVEIELVFPDHHRGPTKFVIELAPADMMPHSVHTFLEMVSAGLLDGCSFILNAMHVLKAAPLPYDGTSAADKAIAFAEKGLESVAFIEYNEDFPHKKYTVGFATDGSPSFYINTADNSEIHVGDPCFGKVVSGFETVHRLEANPTRNGIWFERRIGIKSARILNR